MATIHASVLPPPDHLVNKVSNENERRKRKENPSQPRIQLPGCRDDNTAPKRSERGKIHRKSR
jgi:hypothetical protein